MCSIDGLANEPTNNIPPSLGNLGLEHRATSGLCLIRWSHELIDCSNQINRLHECVFCFWITRVLQRTVRIRYRYGCISSGLYSLANEF